MDKKNEIVAFSAAATSASAQNGLILIDVDTLAQILDISPKSVRTLAPTDPSKLPPRFPCRPALKWLLKDVWSWLANQSQALEQNDGGVTKKEPKPKPQGAARGRPSSVERDAARVKGLSVSEFRRKNQAQAGV